MLCLAFIAMYLIIAQIHTNRFKILNQCMNLKLNFSSILRKYVILFSKSIARSDYEWNTNILEHLYQMIDESDDANYNLFLQSQNILCFY